MKTILYIVAIVAICGSAAFTFLKSGQFKALSKEHLQIIETNKQTVADTAVVEVEVKKVKAAIAKGNDSKATLEQSVSSLKAAGTALTSDISKLDDELNVQNEEFAELEKTLAEVNAVVGKLGGGVTPDTLPAKIEEIAEDKKAKQAKLEELEVAIAGTEKGLLASRTELGRISKRVTDRSLRISGNSMEAVVTAVNQDWGFLVIGAGSNSGFTPQTTLLVKRDGRMIGRVRPSSIEPTQTIAEIDLKSLASGVRLQPGDRVILAQPATN